MDELAVSSWLGGDAVMLWIGKDQVFPLLLEFLLYEPLDEELCLKAIQLISVLVRNHPANQMIAIQENIVHALLSLARGYGFVADLGQWICHTLLFLTYGSSDRLKLITEVENAKDILEEFVGSLDWSAWEHNEAREILKVLEHSVIL